VNNESINYRINESLEDQDESVLRDAARMFVKYCHSKGKTHVTYEEEYEKLR
jgi:hypothetical protein